MPHFPEPQTTAFFSWKSVRGDGKAEESDRRTPGLLWWILFALAVSFTSALLVGWGV